MTENHQKYSTLDKIVRRAIAAGLATREEATQALIQLEFAKLPHDAADDSKAGIREQVEREAEQTAWKQQPQDEQELLEWMTNNLNAAPWVNKAKCVALNPYGNLQALIRVTNEDDYIFRLGISYSQDEENESEFDETFLE